jgi:hypothetical protein
MDPLRYAALYTAALPRARARAAPRRPCRCSATGTSIRPRDRPAAPHAAQLYVAGVECGHTEARQELKRRVAAAEAELETFHAVRDRAQGDREELAAELIAKQRASMRTQMHAGQVEGRSGQGAPAHRRARVVARVADDGAAAPLRSPCEGAARTRAGRLARAAATAPAGGWR